MPTSKRVGLLAVRCATVLVAVTFLVFYVWRAREQRSASFSGSKSAVMSASDAPPIGNPPEKIAPVAPSHLVAPAGASDSPEHLSAPTNPSTENPPAPFNFRIVSDGPVTLGGSKTMSRPIVDTSAMLRKWEVVPRAETHTLGLPPLFTLPPEVTFSKPTITVSAEVTHNTSEPPSTTPSTPLISPAPTTPGATVPATAP